jgi:hypothetical protein
MDRIIEENHCIDCCCAKSWEALGVTAYDGRSIPEHIFELRSRIEELEGRVKAATNKLKGIGFLTQVTEAIKILEGGDSK